MRIADDTFEWDSDCEWVNQIRNNQNRHYHPFQKHFSFYHHYHHQHYIIIITITKKKWSDNFEYSPKSSIKFENEIGINVFFNFW